SPARGRRPTGVARCRTAGRCGSLTGVTAMIVRQLLHTDPAVAASYFVGCAGKRKAMVIDPVADPEPYLRIAAETNTSIRYVVDTHVHDAHRSHRSEIE